MYPRAKFLIEIIIYSENLKNKIIIWIYRYFFMATTRLGYTLSQVNAAHFRAQCETIYLWIFNDEILDGLRIHKIQIE